MSLMKAAAVATVATGVVAALPRLRRKVVQLARDAVKKQPAAIGARDRPAGGDFKVSGSLLEAYHARSDVAPGQAARVSHRFEADDLADFARLAGDTNPLHLDRAFATRPPMQEGGKHHPDVLAHGMLVSSLIPTIFGRTIQGSLYVSQSLR